MYYADNYCKHGTYVGGMGADFMCGWCEGGISDIDYADYVHGLIMRDWANELGVFLINEFGDDLIAGLITFEEFGEVLGAIRTS